MFLQVLTALPGVRTSGHRNEQGRKFGMPHVVNLDLTAADFRQYPAMEFATPHWLLGAIYGRPLLKAKLRQMRPDLQVLTMRDAPEQEQLLEVMVDVLDLRDWPEPKTVTQATA